MPRKLKPYKVDTVSVRGTSPVTIFLDREEKDFFVDVGIARIRAKTSDECKKKAAQALRDGLGNVEWVQEIGVEVVFGAERWNDGTELTLRFTRWERAENVQGDTVTRPFGSKVTGQERAINLSGKLIERNDPRGQWDTVLPYDPELWAGLEKVQAMIVETGRRLRELLEQENAAKALSTIAKGGTLAIGPGDGQD